MEQLSEQALRSAYAGKRVLVAGHTGFKGGWLATWLASLGAEVAGLALAPSTDPSFFEDAAVAEIWTLRQAVARTAEWYQAREKGTQGKGLRDLSMLEVEEYLRAAPRES